MELSQRGHYSEEGLIAIELIILRNGVLGQQATSRSQPKRHFYSSFHRFLAYPT